MTLVQLKDVSDNYQVFAETNNTIAFDQFEVYTGVGDRVGFVKDILVDEQADRFRYLVVDAEAWISGKQVIVPIGLARFDYDARRVYIDGLKKSQIDRLPTYTDDRPINQDYEEIVRKVFRPLAINRGDQSNILFERNTYSYDQDPSLYNAVGNEDAQQLDRYEKLVANRKATRA